MSEKNNDEDKEGDTMIAIEKPNNKAFVLSENKVDSFLKQDNKQFKNAMTRFEKFKSRKKS